jgi:Spx/MgsR family transcriptional regulator
MLAIIISMIIYIHTKCSTCQNAIQFLESKKIPVLVKDIVKEPPSLEELQAMLDFQKGQIKKLLNTSGMMYREIGLSQRLDSMSIVEVLTLLSREGMLIKRPFLLGTNWGLTGFNESKWLEKI